MKTLRKAFWRLFYYLFSFRIVRIVVLYRFLYFDCYLRQNEQNEHDEKDVNRMAITKSMADQTNSASAANLNSSAELGGKNPSQF